MRGEMRDLACPAQEALPPRSQRSIQKTDIAAHVGRQTSNNVRHSFTADPTETAAEHSALLHLQLERIKDILRQSAISPHLNEGGGSGFTYPHGGWSKLHWEIIREFSDLWFSAAGDAFVEQYKDKIPVIPFARQQQFVYRQRNFEV